MWNIKKIISKGDYNYALVPDHPNATANGYVLEHRVVMENYLGRLLNNDEIVHHIDGNKKNNIIENLQVLSSSEHHHLHGIQIGHKMAKLKCPYCHKIFTRHLVQTFVYKSNKYNCTFCSRSCNGKFFRDMQLYGLTHEMENAISENLLTVYIEYPEDNSEETCL